MLVFHWISGKIRIVEGAFRKSRLDVKRSFEVNISEGDFWNRGEEGINEVVKILTNFIKENKIKDKEVYLNFESKDISIRVAEYPKMKIKELENAILDDLIEFQGFEPNLSLFTFIKLSEEGEKQKLAIFTIPKIIVEVWKKIIKSLGLELIVFEPTSISMLRALNSISKEPVDCVIFIGNENTNIFFLDNKRLDSLINISIGVNDLSYISDNVNLEPAIISWNEEVTTYINSYYLNKKEINLVITGEDERFLPLAQNLLQYISANVDILTDIKSLLIGITIDEKLIPRVNFIARRELIDKDLIIRSAISVFLALSLIFPLNFYIDIRIKNLDGKIRVLQMEIDRYNNEINNLRAQVDENNLIVTTLESWIEKKSAIYFPFIFLMDLKYLTPKNVWLTSLEISSDRKLTIEGYSLDTNGVADFLLLLNNYERVKSVRLESSLLEVIGNDKELQKFRIVSELK